MPSFSRIPLRASSFTAALPIAQTVMVSVSSSGVIGNGDCGSAVPAVSADGRFVAFSSHATNSFRMIPTGGGISLSTMR